MSEIYALAASSKQQAASSKQQAASSKQQAASSKQQAAENCMIDLTKIMNIPVRRSRPSGVA